MDYIITTDITAPITSDGFVAQWKVNRKSSAAATAIASAPKHGVLDGGVTIVLATIGSMAAGVAANAIYDLIKLVFAEALAKAKTEKRSGADALPLKENVIVEAKPNVSGMNRVHIRITNKE